MRCSASVSRARTDEVPSPRCRRQGNRAQSWLDRTLTVAPLVLKPLDGSQKTLAFAQKSIRVGADERNELVIADLLVASFHALILCQGGLVRLVAYTDGETRVNAQAVTAECYVFRGDRLTFGRTEYLLLDAPKLCWNLPAH
ncbi:FHA domain-containing protein [Desulfuromonas thiophila]|uniref:FHA domain-containing protein n=1 Tax=Desulfuromonas thiophila TaxID=57664 RepID=UPI0024A96D1A|nr:FHA domain-containing protein [Desulfuromonas thiophila]